MGSGSGFGSNEVLSQSQVGFYSSVFPSFSTKAAQRLLHFIGGQEGWDVKASENRQKLHEGVGEVYGFLVYSSVQGRLDS